MLRHGQHAMLVALDSTYIYDIKWYCYFMFYVTSYPAPVFPFRAFMPIVIKTTPFQNPRNEPVAPTASRSGSDK